MAARDLAALLRRGTIECHTSEDLERKLASGRGLRVKLGVDPTSADLHVGHTVVLNKLRAFQDLGHTAVLIIGDFTALVGDPSGRDATRPTLSADQVRANAATYEAQAFKVLDPARAELRFNSEWLRPFMSAELLPVLRRATVSRLLEREDFTVRARQGLPITLLELLYPVFQGYDSVAVKADVELGGNDQLFNLLMGRQMQRDLGLEPQVCMTLPLLVGTDGGRKMSKSYGNHIGLDDPPRELFGKVMRVSDACMGSYYELLTSEDPAAVAKRHPMEAKLALAELLTARYHGAAAAAAERRFFDATFSKRELPADVPVKEVAGASRPATWSQLAAGLGLAPSRKEAQRLIRQGAFRVDGEAVKEDRIPEDIVAGGEAEHTVQVGRHTFAKVRFKA